MEWGDIILVAVSGFVGVGGTLVGTIVNNHLSRRQMKEVWAEEERRRKSDRRREAREADLRMVRDAVDAAIEVEARVTVLGWQQVDSKSRLEPLFEVLKGLDKALLVASSLQDQDLADKCMQVRAISWDGWICLT